VFAYDFDTAEPIFKDTEYVFVTRSCGSKLVADGLTGFRLEDVETRRSREAEANGLVRNVEPVAWLHIDGEPGKDDFGMHQTMHLIVSERALLLLKELGMKDVEVFDYDPDYETPTLDQLIRKRAR
jgi:hypothetical protein